MLKLKLGPPPHNDLVLQDAHWKAVTGYDASPAGALRMLSKRFAGELALDSADLDRPGYSGCGA
jgi:hypothetical protein